MKSGTTSTAAALFFLLTFIAGSLSLPSFAADEIPNNKIKIFVSIPPQADFVKKIGKDRVKVEVMVLPGHSPALYEPSFRQIMELSKAHAYFRIGVPFENIFISEIKTSIKNLMIVDTRKGIKLRTIRSHSEEGHHENTAGHSHAHTDPHIWLSPKLVKQQAGTIYNTLVLLDPESKKEYTANYQLFLRDLDAIDIQIRKILAPLKGKKIFVFHPSYGYFTDEYGLRQVAVESGGKEPQGGSFVRFVKMAKENQARAIFVQPQFSAKSASAIANAIGGTIITLDPLAGDYISNMKEMALKIKSTLE